MMMMMMMMMIMIIIIDWIISGWVLPIKLSDFD